MMSPELGRVGEARQRVGFRAAAAGFVDRNSRINLVIHIHSKDVKAVETGVKKPEMVLGETRGEKNVLLLG